MNFLKLKVQIIEYLRYNLSPDLYYHNLDHTLEVLKNVKEISQHLNISKHELGLLKIAALFHDSGFVKSYNDHETKSCEIAKDFLLDYNVNNFDLEIIYGLIEATRIPQNPKSEIEKVIADADLMYLGTDRFLEIGNQLFEELKIYTGLSSRNQWNIIQKDFLERHEFHTDYCLAKYGPKKNENLMMVIKMIKN